MFLLDILKKTKHMMWENYNWINQLLVTESEWGGVNSPDFHNALSRSAAINI